MRNAALGILLGVTLSPPPLARAGMRQHPYAFTAPTVEPDGPDEERLVADGLYGYGDGGWGVPSIPYKIARILVPQGQDVIDVRVSAPRAPLQLQGSHHIISVEHATTVQPGHAYDPQAAYPGILFRWVGLHHLRGYQILVLKLYPIQYIEETGVVSYFDTLDVEVMTQSAGRAVHPLFRRLTTDEDWVRGLIDNPAELESYQALPPVSDDPSEIIDPSDTYRYVIITNEVLRPAFEEFAAWKQALGVSTRVVTDLTIRHDPLYRAGSTEEEIRRFIRDAYRRWETEYVVLGGDEEVVPIFRVARAKETNFYNRSETLADESIPADFIYANLDDDPGDSYSEVLLGRLPFTETSQVTTFLDKVRRYHETPRATYQVNVLLAGEFLWGPEGFDSYPNMPKPDWGGDWLDYVRPLLPSGSRVTAWYERDGVAWTGEEMQAALQDDYDIIIHKGHASSWQVAHLGLGSVSTLTEGHPVLFMTSGSSSAAFDDGTGASSMVEEFLIGPAGAFAYVGGTRTTLSVPGSPQVGGSADIIQRFFGELREPGVTRIGEAFTRAKEAYVGSLDTPVNDWDYAVWHFFGDPEMHLQGFGSPSDGEPIFLRGDANRDGTVEISDPIFLLSHLFRGTPAPTCEDAADANDDGTLDISDPVAVLIFLFRAGLPSLPIPGAATPGPDPTPDSLGCQS